MQFKVPQFLDIEDKIFGPFTFREFIYLLGGAGLCYLFYKILGFWIGAIPIIAVASFSLALTFYRPNNKPFIEMVQSFFRFSTQSKLYIWKQRVAKELPSIKEVEKDQAREMLKVGRLTQSKLRDLAWSLDVLDASSGKRES